MYPGQQSRTFLHICENCPDGSTQLAAQDVSLGDLSDGYRGGIHATGSFTVRLRMIHSRDSFASIASALRNLSSGPSYIDTWLAECFFFANTPDRVECDSFILAWTQRRNLTTPATTASSDLDHHGALRSRVATEGRMVV